MVSSEAGDEVVPGVAVISPTEYTRHMGALVVVRHLPNEDSKAGWY